DLGAGVYDYAGTVRTPWNGCAGLFPPAAQLPALEEVQQRLLNIQSLETLHAMDEGVVASPLEIDLASVLGWGYPAWRGGVLGHIDATGPQEFLRQCEALAERHGERFRAPASLRARADTRFHAQ
ncbi:3-hydroxyacyl-CoA dehydrogenase, partial [Bordetella hinzii]